jgi:hypothetical protein
MARGITLTVTEYHKQDQKERAWAAFFIPWTVVMTKPPAETSKYPVNPDPGMVGSLAERLNRNKRILGLVSEIRGAIESADMIGLQDKLNRSLQRPGDYANGQRLYEKKSEVFEGLRQQLARAGITSSLVWREPYDGNAHIIFMSKDGLAAKVLTVSTDLKEAPTAICYSPSGSARLDPGSTLQDFRALLQKNVKSPRHREQG